MKQKKSLLLQLQQQHTHTQKKELLMEKDINCLPVAFIQKKNKILQSLDRPWDEYNDLSPKGSLDERICPLISLINCLPGYVTTSSCAGRISVFIQGKSDGEDENDTTGPDDQIIPIREKKKNQQSQSMNGKGSGGKWIFVSHDPLSIPITSSSLPTTGGKEIQMDCKTAQSPKKNVENLPYDLSCMNVLGLKSLEEVNNISPTTSTTDSEKMRDGKNQENIHSSILFSRTDLPWIHFKFEPMILHVLTASLTHANLLLRVAIQAGFRESGALNLISNTLLKHQSSGDKAPVTPIVAIRSTGLLLESIVGLEFHGQAISIIPEWQLKGLIIKANERFEMNTKRINKLAVLLESEVAKEKSIRESNTSHQHYEDKERRKLRKREEGLRIAKAKKLEKASTIASCNFSLDEDIECLPKEIFRE